jgi:hypothetical protein
LKRFKPVDDPAVDLALRPQTVQPGAEPKSAGQLERERLARRIADGHYRRILGDTSLLLQFCQLHGFLLLDEAVEFILRELEELKE